MLNKRKCIKSVFLPLSFAFVLFFSTGAYAQFSKRLYLATDYNHGQLIYSHGATKYLAQNSLRKFNFTVFYQYDGYNRWHKLYKYPKLGFSFFYIDFGNPQNLGHAYSFTSQLLIPIYKTGNISINQQIESGLAYLNKKFNFTDNYYNVLIGSNFNAFFSLAYQIEYKLMEQLSIYGGISFNHFSNGKMVRPNYGLNSYIAEMGLLFKFTSSKNYYQWQEIQNDYVPPKRHLIHWANGMKDAHILSDKFYYATALSYNLSFANGNKNRWGGGIDIFMDRSALFKSPYSKDEKINKSDMFSSGVYASGDFLYGKVEMFFHLGMYLLKKNKVEKHFIYERCGLRYFTKQNIFAGIALKANLLNADYFEISTGYAW